MPDSPSPAPGSPFRRPRSTGPVYAFTAHSPVAVVRPHRPRPRRRPGFARRQLEPYRRLFEPAGAVAFTLGSFTARLPMGMLSVSAVLMIASTRGSYALAGAVTAVGLGVTAVAGPWTARLVDRYGQARVALPAAVLACAGSCCLAWCVWSGAPDWTLFVCCAATATAPNTGGMARARWEHLHRDAPDVRHTGRAFEQVLDEVGYLAGPPVAAFLCTAFFPELGTLTGALLLLTGVVLFTAQRSSEPPPPPPGAAAGPAPLRSPGVPALLAVFLCTGAVFGATEIATVAYADAQGHPGLAGAVLACQAGGSAVAGLVFGALRPVTGLRRRFRRCVAAMAVLMVLPSAAASTGHLLLLAPALLIAGLATAPTMVTGTALLQHAVPVARLNEGMTLMVTALLAGTAAGAALGGAVAERTDGAGAFAVTAVAGPAAAVLARRRQRPGT